MQSTLTKLNDQICIFSIRVSVKKIYISASLHPNSWIVQFIFTLVIQHHNTWWSTQMEWYNGDKTMVLFIFLSFTLLRVHAIWQWPCREGVWSAMTSQTSVHQWVWPGNISTNCKPYLRFRHCRLEGDKLPLKWEEQSTAIRLGYEYNN